MKPVLRPLVLHDFDDAHALYVELVGTIPVPGGPEGMARFSELLSHPGTTLVGAEIIGHIRSMVTLHILPNMTFSGRPYALIENVITAVEYRDRGLSRAVMQHAIDRAWAADAYKIMLLTGRELGARGFYEKLGFTTDEKHGLTLRRAPKRQPLM